MRWSIVLTAPLVLFSSGAFAATRTWTGGTSGNWSAPSNWGGTAPVSGDDLVFLGVGPAQTSTNDLPSGMLFNSIELSGEFTLNGNAISLGAGGMHNAAGTNVIDLPITLAAAQTWTVNKTTSITLGPTNLNDKALNIVLKPPSDMQWTGPITGSGSITTTGGTLVITGVNPTLAPLSVSEGFLGIDGVYGGAIIGTNASVGIAPGASVGPVSVSGPGGEFGGGLGPVSIGAATTGSLSITGLSVVVTIIDSASSFGQTNVQGTVSLSSAGFLVLGGTTTVPPGTQFMVINNDGTDPIVGDFGITPQGSNITSLGPQPQNFTINYHGGDGNDVVLTAQMPATIATITNLTSSVPQVNAGDPLTLTATVTPASGTVVPTGSVNFIAITSTPSAFSLGTATVNASGVATLSPNTNGLLNGPLVIVAVYSGGGPFQSSSAEADLTVSATIPTLNEWMLILLALAFAGIGLFVISKSLG